MYEDLANAIVIQAVNDYRDAKKKIKIKKKQIYIDIIKECEMFFLSDWFNTLTKLDGKVLLNKLKEE